MKQLKTRKATVTPSWWALWVMFKYRTRQNFQQADYLGRHTCPLLILEAPNACRCTAGLDVGQFASDSTYSTSGHSGLCAHPLELPILLPKQACFLSWCMVNGCSMQCMRLSAPRLHPTSALCSPTRLL